MSARPVFAAAGATLAVGVLLAAVVVVDLLAVRAVVRARAEAVSAAEAEVGRRAEVEARTLEAALAAARADLAVLARLPVLATEGLPATDPVVARRQRLERESALLLFAAGHPVLDELVLVYDGAPAVRIGRAGAEPLVLAAGAPPIDAPLAARLTIADGLELLARSGGPASRGLFEAGSGTIVLREAVEASTPAAGDELVAVEPLVLPGWHAAAQVLERREPRRALLARVEELTAAQSQTLIVLLVLIGLSVGLAVFALREIRRSAVLAAERSLAEERRDLERRLWHSERLASVGRLAAGIAHEINNPLAGMTNWLALLEEDVAAGDDERARTTATRLRQGLERIRDVVGRTLTLASPGGPHLPVDLAAVVAETAAFARDLGGDGHLELRLHLPSTPVMVDGDRSALGQLVLNLLLNARQAQTDAAQTDAAQADVALLATAGQAVLTVEDAGPGIPDELRDRLFEPFVSGRGSIGLGLAVCHGIVRAHGGTVAGENRPQGGARFVVRIPLLEEPSTSAEVARG